MKKKLSLLLALLICAMSVLPGALAEEVYADGIEPAVELAAEIGETALEVDPGDNAAIDEEAAPAEDVDGIEPYVGEIVLDDVSGLYYASLNADLGDLPAGSVVLVTGAAENGAVSVAWQGASGQQTAEVPEGMLTALDDVAYAAFMEKLALRDDVPLYMNQLDYPLPMNDGEAIVIEDGGEQAAEDAEALMAAADGTVIKLNKTEITIGLKEPYAGLVATVEDAEGNPVTGAAVTWTSDNVKIAKVDAK
ncbi:MAG: Ig-like domain-containing protein, partial [Clostridia bacterium]|nr:Ig-like domain-containing protein [Clostridia bacterium]